MESAGATRQHRIQTPPIDTRFVMDLPDEPQPCFNGWATDIQIDPELNVWRQLNFSNGPCCGVLKNVHHRLCSNPVFADARSRDCWANIGVRAIHGRYLHTQRSIT